ncbi:MAG: group II intron reverse transcriptase/maturase [Syntrophus sp. (in: bacteria)]|nr:group II intron reverse transcriptase/maturase [Syntrophus sp. (in: bacteria)]
MEEVCKGENVKKAYQRVKSNKGSPGIDGMTVLELGHYLKEHWVIMKDRLLIGTYQPQPVKRVAIPKPDGSSRILGIPTVVDRFIQQALMQVLQKRWDKEFSPHSYGFRPGRSAHQAVKRAKEYMKEGYTHVVDMDIEKFFDHVNHDILMGQIAKRVKDARIVKLIRAYLTSGVMEGGLVSPTNEGTPQGGPLSPLLSNLVLHTLDLELTRRHHRFVRYADDCNIYVKSERAGHRVMENIATFLSRKLKLRINKTKSAVARPWERTFLGFSVTRGAAKKIRIAEKAVLRFKRRIGQLTRRTRGISIEQMVTQLAAYLNGWKGYFGFCETPSVLNRLDSWIRRRLRSFLWKQWKRGRRRFAELLKRGIRVDLAAQTAGSIHGPWRISSSPALHMALSTSYFISLGLPLLEAR